MRKAQRMAGGALALTVMMASSLVACGDGDDGSEEAGAPVFELAGTWTSDFGEETISDSRWDGFCQQAVVSFDNDGNEAILEIVGGEGCGEGFSKVVWKDIVSDAFDYCTAAFGEASVDEAANAPLSAVNDDPMTGCGGFPWSRLSRKQ